MRERRRMAKQLQYAQIAKATTPGRYFDGGSGLHLLIKRSGRKYWVLRYTFAGRRRDMGLGVFPRQSLAEARKASQAARVQLDSGIDPLAPTPAVQQMAFKEFATSYVQDRRAEWKNATHAAQWLFTLQKYAFPFIGCKPLAEIATEDVLAVLQPIWTTKTETASRLRGRIERILAAATTRGMRSGVNPAVWRGHLDTLLPIPRKVSRVQHHAALAFGDIPVFMEKLRARAALAALALEFTILTAARTNEVTGAERHEVIDGVWTVPAERMKAGRVHRVPLCSRALTILMVAAARDADSPYLFSRAGRKLSNMSMLILLRRMGYPITVHGFRSTFRDWVSECTQHSPELAEMALAHAIPNKAEAAYRRGDLLQPRRLLMSDWEKYCAGDPGKVRMLRAA